MKTTLLLMFFFLFGTLEANAEAKKVAVVKLLRGDVDVMTKGKTTKLKQEDWVEEGSVVKTADKSFVKLVFLDKSQMNVGPGSEMKIESFSGKDAGVIDLVKGKIRSQVTKDYLQMENQNKSKLFIKTPNAVMGIRGTDFMISTNGKNTSTVLFEGEVFFNKLESRGSIPTGQLERIVDKGQRIHPGEFSVVQAGGPPTVPAVLNVEQRENLEGNSNFEDKVPSASTETKAGKSVVPEGLSGEAVANNPEALKNEISQVANVDSPKAEVSMADAKGFVNGDMVKPANGSVLDINTGAMIPPDPKSDFDPNTGTFVQSPDSGVKVSQNGEISLPANVTVTPEGGLVTVIPASNGKVLMIEVKMSPVVSEKGASVQGLAVGSGGDNVSVVVAKVMDAPKVVTTTQDSGSRTTAGTPGTTTAAPAPAPSMGPASGTVVSVQLAPVGQTLTGSSGTVMLSPSGAVMAPPSTTTSIAPAPRAEISRGDIATAINNNTINNTLTQQNQQNTATQVRTTIPTTITVTDGNAP